MTTQRSEPAVAAVGKGNGIGALRVILKLDAWASGALGVVLAGGSTLLAEPLGLPTDLLVPVGLFLVVFAAFVAYGATRPNPPRAGVWAIIEVNVVWVLASVVFVVAGWFSPTTLGTAFVLLQAAAVAVFAGLQYAASRRAGAADRPAAKGGA